MSTAPVASPLPTSHTAPAAAFALACARNGTRDDRGEAVLRDGPREGCRRSGDAVGHLAAELLTALTSVAKSIPEKAFTDVERGPLAGGVPMIVFGELGVPGVLSREQERASSARPIGGEVIKQTIDLIDQDEYARGAPGADSRVVATQAERTYRPKSCSGSGV